MYYARQEEQIRCPDEQIRCPNEQIRGRRSNMAGLHSSIVTRGVFEFSLLQCGRPDCEVINCGGNFYHCPLCPLEKCAKKPSQIRDHFRKVHWENRIDSGGKCTSYCLRGSVRRWPMIMVILFMNMQQRILGLHVTSWRPCWRPC